MLTAVEGVLSILQVGRTTGTNKFGLLLALIDLAPSVEVASPSIDQQALALKLIEIHWDHAREYGRAGDALRQVSSRNRSNSQVLIQVSRLRALARGDNPGYERTLLEVPKGEWDHSIAKVCAFTRKNALSRLQNLAPAQVPPFLFHPVDGASPIRLLPGVAEQLTTYGPLLRALVESRFVERVMQMNQPHFEQVDLHEFLFGDARHMPSTQHRKALTDLQGGRCVYSGAPFQAGSQRMRSAVDHVLAWSRVRLSTTQNLVMTTASMNAAKRELLLAPSAIEAWLQHLNDHWADLDALAIQFGWPSDVKRSVLIARGLYANVPDGAALWSPQGITQLDPPTRERCLALLGSQFAWDT